MPPTFLKKAVLILAAAALIISVSILATRESRTAAAVSTTHAVRHNLSSWISSNGKVEPIEPQVLQAKFTTFVERIGVREGEDVRSGQTLMTLDTRDLETELVHLKEQLVASEDQAKVAES